MELIHEEQRVPVLYDVDVVVAGAGIAGCMAAIAAARYGASVVVVERFGQVGGNIGPGHWAGGTMDLAYHPDTGAPSVMAKQGPGGIVNEFLQRVIRERPGAERMTEDDIAEISNGDDPAWRVGSGGGMPPYLVDADTCSHVLVEMMCEAGVELLLSACVGDPIMEMDGDGERVAGLFVETRSGRVAVKAKVVIDATGQADVAFRAGAPTVNRCSPNLGLWFLVGDVDWDAYNAYRQRAPEAGDKDLDWARNFMATSPQAEDPYPRMHDLIPSLRKAHYAAEFFYRLRVGGGSVHIMLDETHKGNELMRMEHDLGGMMGARTGTYGKIDFSDPAVVTDMEIAHRGQAHRFAKFLRRYIPGFEECYLMFCSPWLGTRGGRHIDAEYAIGMDDVLAGRRFDDVLYDSFEIKRRRSCDFPYRAMLPKEIDGLLVVGTGSMPYPPNFRRRAYVLLQGQAAGVAAALCVGGNVQPRDLDVKKLQRILIHELRCPVGDADRLREIGMEA